ncbi:hypothetical protein BM527_13430 [Alteromonas sp. Mex14]|nr:hypothetical protein BM527_13430 [Alteromonas sp. Mex14]
MKKCNAFQASIRIVTTAIVAVLYSSASLADWSADISAVSDYTFNGLSLSNNNPALQGAVNKVYENGAYAGTWASNFDFGDETNFEWDFYAGRYQMLTDDISIDYGIAYYTYYGGAQSHRSNYPEVYTKFGYISDFGTSELNFWYTWDYFGTGARHSVTMVAHTFELAPNHYLRANFDVSNSLDSEGWTWRGENTSFYHYRLAYSTSYAGFDLEIAAENTNLDLDIADERVVFGISKTFNL